MLDTGANCDCITRDLVGKMGIKTRELMLNIQTVTSQEKETNSLASFIIESLDGKKRIPIENALVAGNFAGETDIPPSQRDLSNFGHLKGIKFPKAKGEVGVIIGVAHANTWINGEVRIGGPKDPIGVETIFGWTVMGTGG